MAALTDFMYMVDDFLWGTWMTVLLLGVGIVLSIRFGFRYQKKIGFNFKNTFGQIGVKGEGEGTISGFRAACTALANTVGTGNISGVATAIVSGGPAPWSGCGYPPSSACPPRPARSSSASGTASTTRNP